MKILSAKQIKFLDESTVRNQRISSLDLMARAGTAAFGWIVGQKFGDDVSFSVFCGVGNNGGDGLVIARLLFERGYDVLVYVVGFRDEYSVEFKENFERLKALNIHYIVLNDGEDIGKIRESSVVVDAVFGIGLSKTPAAFVVELFRAINTQNSFVVSIDVPSGLFLHKEPEDKEAVVVADVTLSFHIPKLILYLPNIAHYAGEAVVLDIGLDENCLETLDTNQIYVDKKFISEKYKSVSRLAHKGTQGHSLIIGGSYGKIGAVTLASKACLKSGCGLVTVFSPACGYVIVQTSFPEAMVLTDVNNDYISKIDFAFEPNAIGIGVGIGQREETANAIYEFLKNNTKSVVVDADAINILSSNKDWLTLLPPSKTIITPHPKELERLIGAWVDDFDKLEKAKNLSKLYNFIIIIKGATTITIDGDDVYVNSTGNQALATAGSGDVLMGIVTGLLAQGYCPIDAATLGVYLHGITADIGKTEMGYQSFTATSIIEYMGKAYLDLEKPYLFTNFLVEE